MAQKKSPSSSKLSFFRKERSDKLPDINIEPIEPSKSVSNSMQHILDTINTTKNAIGDIDIKNRLNELKSLINIRLTKPNLDGHLIEKTRIIDNSIKANILHNVTGKKNITETDIRNYDYILTKHIESLREILKMHEENL